MPKPSSAFAASFIISRSESEPITIATNGLSAMVSLFCRGLQRPRSNVFPVMHAFELDERARRVGALDGLLERLAARGHAEHASAGGDELSGSVLRRTRVEDFHVPQFRGGFEAGDDLAFRELARISPGRDHHAAR